MRYTQRMNRILSSLVLLSGWLLVNAQAGSHPAPANPQPVPYTSQALLFAKQVDELDPNNVHDLYKVFVVLRCRDVPVEQRKALAMRILTGDYPSKPGFKWIASDQQYGLFVAALVALSYMHMDDASLLSFLEEYLPKWKRIMQSGSGEELPTDLRRLQERVSPDVALARAVIVRLKAVQAVPEVKSAADLARRLEVMLKEAGLSRAELVKQYEEFLEAERRAGIAAWATKSPFPLYLVQEYGRMLFHYAKRGMDVRAAVTGDDAVAKAWHSFIRLGETAREPALLVEQLLSSKGRDTVLAQLLVDEGVRVVPLIVQRLEVAKEDPTKLSEMGMGVSTLLEVLVSLLGKEALDLIEAWQGSDKEWLCRYAHRAKEWGQQGYVFGFYPSL
ncbi:MAG: hypothetical protein KatS3mg019_1067 [Fimbriimonadales bacterium]|nr:MAG: hypothetical protein KatS3mg019_1067 [Fimbriimonadales bacterium]